MNSLKNWLKASRLQSQSYIFLPILLGQAWFVIQGNPLNWSIFCIMTLFGLFDQLFIVYANDYADFETDCMNTTFNIFSGGSRVLADKDLSPEQLRNASVLMAILCLLCGVVLTLFFRRNLSVPIVGVALGLLWMYSYAPFRLSYRGGGEFLQMTGVGLVLPFFGYYAQSGTTAGFPWELLLVILPTQLACAMTTALPDEPSDRVSKKRTLVVILGAQRTKYLILGLNVISIAAFPFVSWLPPSDPQVYMILFTPALAGIAQIFLINSSPGSRKLTVFVFLSVLTTLSIMGGMAISLLG